MKLYLIRHGESANNAALSGAGDLNDRVPDPELTEAGHQQASLLADHLADPSGDPLAYPTIERNGDGQGFGLTHVYCSLMTRSILTAQYVATACALPLIAHPDIFERHGVYAVSADGTKQGKPGPDRKYFDERFPELDLPSQVGTGGWYDRPAESREQFLQRSRQVALDFAANHAGTDDSVAMVIHGDLIDQLINEFTTLGHPAAIDTNHAPARWAIHNTSITRIDFNETARVIIYTNRLQHLPPQLVTS